MPKIKVQSTKPIPRQKKGGVLDRIQPVTEMERDGIKINVYGRGKTGKTRLASTFPKPVIIIGTEKGTDSISNVKGVEFVRIVSTDEFGEIVTEAKTGRWKTIVLDTAGGLQDMILKEVAGLDDIPVQKTWGIADQKTWGIVGMQCKERLRNVLDLAETHKMNVVIIAHERNFNDESGTNDLIFPTVGSALSPSVAGWLNGACNYICQCFIREGTTEKKVKIGTKETTVIKPSGVKEFCLRIGPHPVFMTGFRLPVGKALPEFIPDPSYTKIVELVDG